MKWVFEPLPAATLSSIGLACALQLEPFQSALSATVRTTLTFVLFGVWVLMVMTVLVQTSQQDGRGKTYKPGDENW